MSFTVSQQGRDELEAIWDYIGVQNHSPGAAERLVETFYEKFVLLGRDPLIGERCQEYEHLVPGLRRFSVGNYIIYYRPNDDGVEVGHIVHGARDQEALFRKWFLSRE